MRSAAAIYRPINFHCQLAILVDTKTMDNPNDSIAILSRSHLCCQNQWQLFNHHCGYKLRICKKFDPYWLWYSGNRQNVCIFMSLTNNTLWTSLFYLSSSDFEIINRTQKAGLWKPTRMLILQLFVLIHNNDCDDIFNSISESVTKTLVLQFQKGYN